MRLRHRLLITAVVAAAVVTVVLSVAALLTAHAAGRGPVARTAEFALLIGLFVSANKLPLRLQFRADRMAHVWDEVPLVLGLGFLTAPDLLIAVWLGGLLAHASAGRGGVKAAYNAGVATLGALAAVALIGAAGQWLPLGSSWQHVPFLLLACLTYSLINDLAISAVVSQVQREPLWRVMREGFWVNHVLCLTGGLAGIGFLLITGDHRVTLLVLPLVVLGLHGAQAGALRVLQEREAWERLDLATRALNQLNHSAVLDVAVTRATELFRCDGVEVLLERGGPGIVTQTAVGSIGGRDRPAGPGGDTGRPAGGPPSAGPERSGSVVSRELAGSGVRVGELRLYYSTAVVLSERESWALSTFSHAVAAALLNAALYEKLQDHADRKAHEAAHDPLTGLANRSVLTERGAQMLSAALTRRRWAALFLVDLDRFKQVNDSLGHEVGDEMLRETGRRLVAGVRPTDLVVRLGGDEFALLLPDLAGDADVAAARSHLQSALVGPMTVGGVQMTIRASIGVASAPTDGVTIPDLLRQADAAMYRAKGVSQATPGAGGGRQPGVPRRGEWRGGRAARLVSELHPSLHHGELELHFQPKVDLRTGVAQGAEALARWRTPDGQLLRASSFMPVVEASTMVCGFARQVLDLALTAASSWSVEMAPATIAVNLSARDLLDRSLPGDVAAALDRHAVAPGRLILEITETVMMSRLEVVEAVLGELRGVGVQLSVDDFGTGFSSLTFLSRVDVQELKIDQSFVGRMLANRVDDTIVETLLGLGRRLGLRIVAEGVETGRQRDHLAALGCETAQGHFLGPPMPPAELQRLLGIPGLPRPLPAPFHPKGRG